MVIPAPAVLIAIHGVGNPVTGEIEKLVRDSLAAGRVENVDVREFNWNAPGLYPLKAGSLRAQSTEDLARGLLKAASIGFADGHAEYAGFGRAGIAVHNLLASAAHFFVALAFALILVLPLLTGLVLFPVHWFASYTAEQFRVIGWLLAGTFIAGLTALGLLLLLGAGYMLVGAGRRRGYATVTPLAATARRALLILLRPAVLLALPPFVLPAQTAVGRWFDLFKYGNLAALLVLYPVIWWTGSAIPFPTYALVTNVVFVAFVVTCWLAVRVTRSVIAPSLKIFLDIFRYVSDRNYRDWLQSLLDQVIEEEHAKRRRLLVFLAHSLGSVIAADSLVNSVAWNRDDRVLLITMGPPLRRFFFRFLPKLFFPPSADAIGDSAAARLGDFRWVNVYRPWDQLGARLKLTRRGSAERSSGQWGRVLTAHPNYWKDETVRIRAEQVIKAIQALPSPGWQLDDHRPLDKPFMPQPDERDPPAVAGYLLVAAFLLLATPIVFGVAAGASKQRWDAILAQKKDDLERHGAKADATVIHRVKTDIKLEPVTTYDTGGRPRTEFVQRTRYIDQFEFRFTPEHGAEVTKKLDIHREGWNEHERFFDPESLRDAVAARGEVLGTSWWRSADSIGRELRHVRLVYATDDLTDPDSMWILLPDYPPQPLTFKHVADWFWIVVLSLLAAGVGFTILVGGYICFLYFVGGAHKFGSRAVWEAVTRE
jgi:hypothetical protein